MKIFNDFRKVALFILLIIILPVFFHYPIQITDALSLKPANDFGIHISFWRVIFEPIMGLMLFFNRSLYAIEENELILYWMLIFFFIYSIFKFIRLREKKEKKKYLISQLINLPIVVGLWFTYFVVLLFLSRYLPANTIVNNSGDKILVTTHSHSDFSHDGLVSQKGLWEWHKYNNFDAFFITDHNNHSKTLDFVIAQRRGEFPAEPLVMCGEEFSGSNHLSLLGLKRKFSTKGYTDTQVIDSTRANGGVVLVNHWYDGEKKSLQYYKDLGVDGFEIENTANEKTYDREIYSRVRDFCESNNLIMNGGLDYHGYGNVCSLWNALMIPGWHKLNQEEQEEAILNIFKSRDQNKLQVLLYTDRPYYSRDHLFAMPVITFFNYFRTLNFYQIMSWIVWLILAFLIKNYVSKNRDQTYVAGRFLPLFGIAGAVFMLSLGFVYLSKSKELAGTLNDIYIEYSTIVFYTGSVFLLYSVIVTYFRYKKEN